ncbi:MAG: hypothetical protein PHY16_03770 [Methylobacter sp.]|nr:hypothetical protein [Methylobacter sp.]
MNAAIGKKRGIYFEDVVFCLQSGGLLNDISHPNDEKYAHQRVFVITIDNYGSSQIPFASEWHQCMQRFP